MECGKMLSALSEYLDGELEKALCAQIEAHMAECSDCKMVVDTLRKTVVLYHQHGQVEVPLDVKQRLYKVLKLDELKT